MKLLNLRDIVMARVDQMKALYEPSANVGHEGEKGAFREFFVAELLRPLLPTHFGIGSGLVVDHLGRQSPQLDVIVYDSRQVPPILRAGERGIYALDSVVAVCEVKSSLDASDYEQILDASVCFWPQRPECLAMTPGNAGATFPHIAVFAYTSNAPQKQESTRLLEQATAQGKQPDSVQLICVLDKGIWLIQPDGSYHQDIALKDDRSRGAQFAMLFLNRIEETARTRNAFSLQAWFRP